MEQSSMQHSSMQHENHPEHRSSTTEEDHNSTDHTTTRSNESIQDPEATSPRFRVEEQSETATSSTNSLGRSTVTQSAKMPPIPVWEGKESYNVDAFASDENAGVDLTASHNNQGKPRTPQSSQYPQGQSIRHGTSRERADQPRVPRENLKSHVTPALKQANVTQESGTHSSHTRRRHTSVDSTRTVFRGPTLREGLNDPQTEWVLAFDDALTFLRALSPEEYQIGVGTHVVNIKTDSVQNVIVSIRSGQWSTIENVSLRIDKIWRERKNPDAKVLFLVSVSGAKQYAGLAELQGGWDPSMAIDGWINVPNRDRVSCSGGFSIKWVLVKDVAFHHFLDLQQTNGNSVANMWNGMGFDSPLDRDILSTYINFRSRSSIIARPRGVNDDPFGSSIRSSRHGRGSWKAARNGQAERLAASATAQMASEPIPAPNYPGPHWKNRELYSSSLQHPDGITESESRRLGASPLPVRPHDDDSTPDRVSGHEFIADPFVSPPLFPLSFESHDAAFSHGPASAPMRPLTPRHHPVTALPGIWYSPTYAAFPQHGLALPWMLQSESTHETGFAHRGVAPLQPFFGQAEPDFAPYHAEEVHQAQQYGTAIFSDTASVEHEQHRPQSTFISPTLQSRRQYPSNLDLDPQTNAPVSGPNAVDFEANDLRNSYASGEYGHIPSARFDHVASAPYSFAPGLSARNDYFEPLRSETHSFPGAHSETPSSPTLSSWFARNSNQRSTYAARYGNIPIGFDHDLVDPDESLSELHISSMQPRVPTTQARFPYSSPARMMRRHSSEQTPIRLPRSAGAPQQERLSSFLHVPQSTYAIDQDRLQDLQAQAATFGQSQSRIPPQGQDIRSFHNSYQGSATGGSTRRAAPPPALHGFQFSTANTAPPTVVQAEHVRTATPRHMRQQESKLKGQLHGLLAELYHTDGELAADAITAQHERTLRAKTKYLVHQKKEVETELKSLGVSGLSSMAGTGPWEVTSNDGSSDAAVAGSDADFSPSFDARMEDSVASLVADDE